MVANAVNPGVTPASNAGLGNMVDKFHRTALLSSVFCSPPHNDQRSTIKTKHAGELECPANSDSHTTGKKMRRLNSESAEH